MPENIIPEEYVPCDLCGAEDARVLTPVGGVSHPAHGVGKGDRDRRGNEADSQARDYPPQD